MYDKNRIHAVLFIGNRDSLLNNNNNTVVYK